jgi:predicted phage terminase large subunit-like protein
MDLADTLKKRSDWTVIAVWDLVPAVESDDESLRRPSRLLLVDVRRVRVEGDTHLPLIEEINGRYSPKWHGVEEAMLGRQLIKRAIRSGLRMHGLKADRDKISRSETATTWCANGRVYFRRGAGWLSGYERELLVFPNGKHDDQVDVTSYACEEADRLRHLRTRRSKVKAGGDKIRDAVRRRQRGPQRHPELGRL